MTTITEMMRSERSEKAPLHVILTVPHADCPDLAYAGHQCDLYAPAAAQLLIETMESHDFHNYTVFYGNMPRIALDLNREPSRHSSRFRQLIRDEIELRRNRDGDRVVVLDVHSYPHSSDWQHSKKSEKSKYAFVILDDRHPVSEDATRLARAVEQRMDAKFQDKFGRVGLLPGAHNDIIDEATELGASTALLLEFHEQTPRAMNAQICEAVVNALVVNARH